MKRLSLALRRKHHLLITILSPTPAQPVAAPYRSVEVRHVSDTLPFSQNAWLDDLVKYASPEPDDDSKFRL